MNHVSSCISFFFLVDKCFFFMSNLDRMGDLAIVYVSQIVCVSVKRSAQKFHLTVDTGKLPQTTFA